MKVAGLEELRQMYADVEPVTTDDGPAHRAVIGQATVIADAAGNLTVEVPPASRSPSAPRSRPRP